MNVYVITYPAPKDIKKIVKIDQNDYVIAVDQGLYFANKQRIKIDLVVGDFDSLRMKSLLHGLNVEKLEVEKDFTDTHHALIKAQEMNPDEIYLIGGIGGERPEHTYANIMLLNHFKNLKILTENSIFEIVTEYKKTTWDGFLNIFPFNKSIITLKGFKYDLKEHELEKFNTLGISNYLTKDFGEIYVHEGQILLIQTKKNALKAF